jgi:hypothetical protein
MPAKPSFSGAERTAPENLKEPENPYVREKIFILLLMNDGKLIKRLVNFRYCISNSSGLGSSGRSR